MSNEELFSEQEDTKPTNGGKAKSLYVQLKPEVHEQLTLLAQVKGNALAKEIRDAIEAHIEAAKAAPDLATQAQAALDEIEQEAAARKAAIAGLLGNTGQEGQPSTSSGRRGRKPKDQEVSES